MRRSLQRGTLFPPEAGDILSAIDRIHYDNFSMIIARAAKIARLTLGLILGTVAIALIAKLTAPLFEPPRLFDHQALKTATDVVVPMSSLLVSRDIAHVCVLGPYLRGQTQFGPEQAELTQQMQDTPVDEGHVRIAAFDRNSNILQVHDLPTGHGQIRIKLEGVDPAFCQSAEAVAAEVSDHQGFITVSLTP